MERDNSSVIIRSGEVIVAIPTNILIQESSVFKALYESAENNNRPDSSNSGYDSGRGSSLGGQENHPIEDFERSYTFGLAQKYVTINLSNYNPKSVEILFTSLKGFSLINGCASLPVLFGILQLCNDYEISKPLIEISERIKTCDRITMENLIDVMKIVEAIEKMKVFFEMSDHLFQRCVSYARWNFSSWQIILKILMEKKDDVQLILRILKNLRDESETTVRYKVFSLSKVGSVTISPVFILRNLEWRVTIDMSEKRYITVCVVCNNPKGSERWKCDSKIELKIINQKHLANSVTNVKQHSFDKDNGRVTFTNIIEFDADLYADGFLKEDTLEVELKISISHLDGVSKGLDRYGHNEAWFDVTLKELSLPESQPLTQKDSSLECDKDSTVVFTSGKIVAAVYKSVLIKESSYFRTSLAGNWKSSECCDANCPKHVDLSKYNPLSVKYLMEYLSDFKDLLQGCKELTVLGDILILCDYYGIGKPVTEIRNVIYETAIDFSNAIESFEVSRKIELIDAFADLASHLRMKSASFLRFNLAGWQLLIYFLVANENKIDIAVDILEELAEKEEALIRIKTPQLSLWKSNVETRIFIHQNMLWSIQFKVDKSLKEIQFVLWCKNAKEHTKAATCNVGSRLFVYYYSSELCLTRVKPGESLVEARHTSWSRDKVATGLSCQYSPDMGRVLALVMKAQELDVLFGKDGVLHFEVELNADQPNGIPSSLGITEDFLN